MRRVTAIVTAILLIIGMTAMVCAQSAATSMEFHATVNADGTCQITQRLNLYLETPQNDLTFPIPSNARDVRVNGSGASVSRKENVLQVNLGRLLGNMAGNATVSLSYTLPNVIQTGSKGLTLTLPILCGFSLGVQEMNFSITLPGEITAKPTFTSTYHQTLIEQNMNFAVTDTQIVGNLTTNLMDRDWLYMTLPVTEALFPQQQPIVWSMDLPEVLMLVFAILALVYWIIFLRCLPPRRLRRVTPPDGITAGDIAPALTMGRTDLTMLVVQWAQLGYILIHLDDNGRVFLHKRMGMGNERSGYENRIFKQLFGQKQIVEATGLRYALLCRKVSAGKPGIHGLYLRQSGSPLIFRGIAACIGLFAGVSVGDILGAEAVFQGLLVFFLGLLGLVSAWFIQEGCKQLHLRWKLPLWVSLALSAFWLVLGAIAGELNVAAWNVAAQLFVGLAAAYGGRRTDLGKQAMAQILGLRRYMTSVTHQELQQILDTNPEFYHNLAPYALAMGVDASFAKRFRGIRLPACPYLTTGMDGHRTATEWNRLLRDAVAAMDERQRQLLLDRLFGKLH